MNNIPKKLRDKMNTDLFYRRCCRENNDCDGRITWEHCFTYVGRQIQEIWAIIPLCVYHHLGSGLNKRLNEKIAFSRATLGDLAKYPKKNWKLYKYKK